MKTALAIRHVPFEDLGAFAPALRDAGFAVRYLDVGQDDLAGLDGAAPDLLCVLGGPIGADQEAAYPFLTDELRLIGRRLEADRPLLGICLGAQLIARAAGARIFRAREPEIGFAPLTLTDAGRQSCLRAFAHDPITLHWHADTFDLPAGAEHLATTDRCANQAFALGAQVIGFQFHPEAGAGSLEPWLIGHAVELAAAGIDRARLREDAALYGPRLARKARDVATAWLAQIRI